MHVSTDSSILKRGLAVLAWLLAAAPTPAAALEPLGTYLSAARTHAAEGQQATATLRQRGADTATARAELFPRLEARASYTRNQYEIIVQIPVGENLFDEAIITPLDQLDATFVLTAPLLDLSAVRRLQSAKADESASLSDRETTWRDLDERVASAHTRIIAYAALTDSAERSEAAARSNLEVVRARALAGLASLLDVERASAQVDSSSRTLADAKLQHRSAERELEALTELAVEGPVPATSDDLHEEPPLDVWLATLDQTSTVKTALRQLESASAQDKAARAEWVPRVVATAQERLTNAAGFGKVSQWSVGVGLTANFDMRTLYRTRARNAAVAVAEARHEQVVRDQRRAIEDAYDRVATVRTRAQAARSEARASEVALSVAQARYSGGTATQLEVVQALRDAFSAEAARIQADSELVYARIQLRLTAARPVEETP